MTRHSDQEAVKLLLKTATGGISKNIVDLQNVVKESAWKRYSNSRQKDFPTAVKKVRLDFDWTGVKFIPTKPKYSDHGTVQYESNILFESVFKNNSNQEQHHSLKTEQQTTGTCKSSITKGYTTGFNVGLTLSAPSDIVGTTAGFSKGFSVENTLANEDQRTMTWSAEGVLLVEKQSMLTAKLQITEKQSSYTFTTNVAVKGEVIVTFYERKNNKYLMEYRAPIRTILVQKKDKFKDDKGKIFVEDIDGTAYVKVEGECIFKYGIKQEIIINQNSNKEQNVLS
ncbi:uncharacterized protein LOC134683124 isoform X1 [Mytilus trossulus]|uniref:uncharacterized protein LOC134683124 isoform X1 n=1 Tax=Mytilus trossulus TaxID=6551 RepID=UPI0030049B71